MIVSPEKHRLEEIRTALRAENISWGELAELQGLVSFIDPGDVELLEAAGVPEFPDSKFLVRVEFYVTAADRDEASQNVQRALEHAKGFSPVPPFSVRWTSRDES